MSMSEKTRQASKTAQSTQQPQEQPQKGVHASQILKEVHEMLRLQRAQIEELVSSEQSTSSALYETLKLQGAMLDDALAALQDLTSVVQTILLTLKTHSSGVEIDWVEDDENENEADDEDAEYDAEEDFADQETAVLPSSWMEEELEATPQRRTAAQPADLTGPQPLLLPYSGKALLQKHKGVRV